MYVQLWQAAKICMQTSTSTLTRLYWTRQGPCCRHARRWVETTAFHRSLPFIGPNPTFESIGIRAPIASALRLAFPNIKYPTEAQKEFIPAILGGKDVLLKDATGTGKYVQIMLVRFIQLIVPIQIFWGHSGSIEQSS